MGSQIVNHLKILDGKFRELGRKKSVYLEGGQIFYKKSAKHSITKVTPFNGLERPSKTPQTSKRENNALYGSLKPILTLSRIIGIFPVYNTRQTFQVSKSCLVYSMGIFFLVFGYIIYIRYSKLDAVKTAEGRFEEAVIDYLFSVYLLPIIINVISWYEARKQSRVLTKIIAFENIYFRTTKKKFVTPLGHKPLILTIALPVIAVATMVVTHVTMVQFKQFHPLQVKRIKSIFKPGNLPYSLLGIPTTC